ncbi:MAG: S-methyl-5-thioribose-1-phosphate isomerase [Methanomicrobiales archaeon]|nr:S-methyl-5-thioribose-1-phosphate isomerase [Methanomicrobiales archaeon]
MDEHRTLWWDEASSVLCFIDQTALPGEVRFVRCDSVERLVDAIRRLEIRGAPALGVAGAYGVVLAAKARRDASGRDQEELQRRFQEEVDRLELARPTAVNLSWGVRRVLSRLEASGDPAAAFESALREAHAIARKDGEICERIGDHGAALIPDGSTVMTHCNAGALACTRWGTALGVVRSAVRQGKLVKVIACETRPLLQGSRLTAWELVRDRIDVSVVPDSSAAFLMRRGEVDLVIVGADRITRGAVFNKIGTYMHAVCARHHHIPFYVAAPHSTFDRTGKEADVVIERRPAEEISWSGSRRVVPEGAGVINYAFDATPLNLVDALITEDGVIRPPFAHLSGCYDDDPYARR